MTITNSTAADIDEIFRLYRIATAYQKPRYKVCWPEFDPDMIRREVDENRQWKLVIDNQIACIWATTFDDPDIWEERNSDPSVYIHRIATNPNFRGQAFVTVIVKWCTEYAKYHHKKYIRLDTVGANTKLIEHYTKCGFDYLGMIKLKDTTTLPPHYQMDDVSLFEIKI